MNKITIEQVYELAKKSLVYADTPVFSKKGNYRMLRSDVRFQLNENTLWIKEGFIWDESSVPYVFQWVFPKSGIYAVPALLHDALYYLNATSKEFADKEFKRWMQAVKTPGFQIWFRYNAVKYFGGNWWKKHKTSPSNISLYNRTKIQLL